MSEMDALRGRVDFLVALDALLQARHVTRAAQIARLSQPAMSRMLARLRSIFNDPLLIRDGARMRLTPRAEALGEPVRDLLRSANALFVPDTFDPGSAQRVFRAVVPDVIAAVTIPAIVGRFRGEAPGCRLDLMPWPGPDSPDIVMTSEIDVFSGFRMVPLFQDRDVLVARSGNLSADDVVDPLALAHVAVVAAGRLQDPVDRWLASIGRSRVIAAVVPHYLLALQLVANSELVAILPSRLVASVGPASDVEARELPITQKADQIWLLHPPHHDADPASLWIRRIVIDSIGESIQDMPMNVC